MLILSAKKSEETRGRCYFWEGDTWAQASYTRNSLLRLPIAMGAITYNPVLFLIHFFKEKSFRGIFDRGLLSF